MTKPQKYPIHKEDGSDAVRIIMEAGPAQLEPVAERVQDMFKAEKIDLDRPVVLPILRRTLCLLAAVLILLNSFAVAETVPVDNMLQPGDSGTAVEELQIRLKALNYFSGKVNGEYNTLTRTAVMEVQIAYGLEATGIADEETLRIIFGDCYRPLSYNDQGSDVRRLQERLAELGYYTGNISDRFLDKTRAAVSQVQADFGLEVTGAADVWTLQLIFSDISKPTPTPIPAFAMEEVQTFKRKLSYGSTGTDVQKVQQRLMDLGYFTFHKTTTGYYRQTQQAVKDFQAKNGLFVTGEVDEKTWNVLFNDDSVVAADGVPKPEATPEPIAFQVEVDVNNQVVKVWSWTADTGGYTTLYKCFLCSSGTKSNPSTPGTYVLSGRKARWCYFNKWGGSKAQYWTKIDEEIAFHSVIYSDYDEMTLRTSSLNNLGTRQSHGCIRLTVADAKWIYDNCGEGTVVVIREDCPDDPELVAAIKPGKLDKSVMLPQTTPAPTATPHYDPYYPPAGEMRSLSSGKSGADVWWLQMKLKELGFYKGTVTGTYLAGTKAAVKQYQRANGLSSDGVATLATLKLLYQQAAMTKPKTTPTPSPVPAPSFVSSSPAPSPAPTPTPLPTVTPAQNR